MSESTSSRVDRRPWLMKLKPFWLREKLFWKLFHYRAGDEDLFKQARLELAPDVTLDLVRSDICHRQIAYMGFYELEVSIPMTRLAALGGLLVDVGANYGYYSCLWASLNRANKVVAFEASPDNEEPLRQNIVRNGLSEQIDVRPIAIGKERGTLPFSSKSEEQTGWGGLLLPDETAAVHVPVDTLDNLFPNEYIDVLKIDTEGADTWVLYGAERLLKEKKIRHIFFEEHKVRMAELGIKTDEARNFLEKLNYRVTPLSVMEFYATPGLPMPEIR